MKTKVILSSLLAVVVSVIATIFLTLNRSKSEQKYKIIHNIILMDESGSMSSLRNTAIDGAADVINSVRAANDTIPDLKQYLTLVFFEGYRKLHLKYIVDGSPINECEAEVDQYRPCGCTPLFDAIGEVVLHHTPNIGQDDYVMMTIITDGMENASTKFHAKDIKKMVKDLSSRNWSFTYISANQDAIHEGNKIGIRDSHNYLNTYDGYSRMISSENSRRNAAISRMSREQVRKKERRN